MKVLWLCNVAIPEIAKAMGEKIPASGGWLSGLYQKLSDKPNMELFIFFPNGEKRVDGRIDQAYYFGFNSSENNKDFFRTAIKRINPDIVHIFGTEFEHTLNMLIACQECKILYRTIVNIQGLVSCCAIHCLGSIPHKVVNSKTLYDRIRRTDLISYQKNLQIRGINEIKALSIAKNVIGRTEWDYLAIKSINEDVQYYYCGEILRSCFYENKWAYEKIEKYSIFVNHANTPLKAIYIILQALPNVINRFPKTHLYCTGTDLLKKEINSPIKLTSYDKYILSIIHKNHLEDRITFLGTLTEAQMLERFLKTHVCVSTSAIENSSNTIGEAMILGVPTISSNVGGVSSLMKDKVDGYLYQFDAPYLLENYIIKVFEDEQIALSFSNNARKHAMCTHDRDGIIDDLLNIYHNLSQE